MQPPRLVDTAERIISPSGERLITMQKQLEGEPRSILMSSVDRVAHIDGQLMHHKHALPAGV